MWQRSVPCWKGFSPAKIERLRPREASLGNSNSSYLTERLIFSSLNLFEIRPRMSGHPTLDPRLLSSASLTCVTGTGQIMSGKHNV